VLEVLEVAARYAARGGPLRGYGGPLRGSRRAATRRPPNHDEASTRCRYAAQVYHTRPKLFYEAQCLQLFIVAETIYKRPKKIESNRIESTRTDGTH